MMRKRPRCRFIISDIPDLISLWPDYYGPDALKKAKEGLIGKRVGRRKGPCTEQELQTFFNGGPISKTRRLEIFRAFMKRLKGLQALLLYHHRRQWGRHLNSLVAIRMATRRGEDLATKLGRWRH